MIGSRGVAVELKPEAIGRTIDDRTHHVIIGKVAKKTGRSVFSIIHLSIKAQEHRTLMSIYQVFLEVYAGNLMNTSVKEHR